MAPFGPKSRTGVVVPCSIITVNGSAAEARCQRMRHGPGTVNSAVTMSWLSRQWPTSTQAGPAGVAVAGIVVAVGAWAGEGRATSGAIVGVELLEGVGVGSGARVAVGVGRLVATGATATAGGD